MEAIEQTPVNPTTITPEIQRGLQGAAFGFTEGAGWGSVPGLITLALAAFGFWNGKGFKGAAFFLVLGVIICSVFGAAVGSIFPRAVGRVLGCCVGVFVGYIVGGAVVGGMWSPHYVRGMLIGGIAGAIIGFILGKHRFRTLAAAWKRKAIGPLEIPNKS